MKQINFCYGRCILAVGALLFVGCAPKPEKLQDTLEISPNLSLNQQKAPSSFPKNPAELAVGDWTYSVTAKKWRQAYFPASADVQIKYLVAHSTTIIVEGAENDVEDYAGYIISDMDSSAHIVELISDNKPEGIVSVTFIKGSVERR